jgi:hypothetical protein
LNEETKEFSVATSHGASDFRTAEGAPDTPLPLISCERLSPGSKHAVANFESVKPVVVLLARQPKLTEFRSRRSARQRAEYMRRRLALASDCEY